MNTKTCKRCGLSKPATNEHFQHLPKRNNFVDSICRACRGVRRREIYAAKMVSNRTQDAQSALLPVTTATTADERATLVLLNNMVNGDKVTLPCGLTVTRDFYLDTLKTEYVVTGSAGSKSFIVSRKQLSKAINAIMEHLGYTLRCKQYFTDSVHVDEILHAPEQFRFHIPKKAG